MALFQRFYITKELLDDMASAACLNYEERIANLRTFFPGVALLEDERLAAVESVIPDVVVGHEEV